MPEPLPAPIKWVSGLAELERQRRKDFSITREAALHFRSVLSAQIHSDLNDYFREFPNERPYIDLRIEDDKTTIQRIRDEGSTYTGLPCCVLFSIELHSMCLNCSFPHREPLNKEFPLAVDSAGAIGLANESIPGLSQYLLAPVLFDKLRPENVP